MNLLALKIQEGLGRDPHAGDLYVFRGHRDSLRQSESTRRHAAEKRGLLQVLR
jgi:hypothetical protein